jgi:hypothetical protein
VLRVVRRRPQLQTQNSPLPGVGEAAIALLVEVHHVLAELDQP